ncbi:ABC transporter substrate-binding protein [Pseudorhodoplanes sp.]|uniref:ABC transporter substrate-binding protein n=1 Tax=Pseudorhodoplanes sp. TaxID=1934341 RepID=UPI003D0C70A6
MTRKTNSSTTVTRRTFVAAAGAVTAAGALRIPASAQTLEKVTIGTSWKAQGEHGGYYQALATGLYQKHGLDVTIRMGGPQVRYSQVLAAKQIEFSQGESFTALGYVKENVPLCCIAAPFQKDVRVLISHPGQGNDSLAALKGKPILVAGSSRVTYWNYLKAKYGYTEEQARPYSFSLAPFLADKSLSVQGYVTSEPFQIEKAGVKPVVHLLANDGYANYANTLETHWDLVKQKPDMIQRFVNATIEGWYSYIYKDPSPANELIKKANPEQSDDLLAYAQKTMRDQQIIDSGDSLKLGIGAMTDARWKAFQQALAPTGMYPADIDLSKAYTLQFVNKGHGLNLKS